MSFYSTLGSLTCEEDGNLSTRDLGITIYVSSEGRVGCEFIHPAQPTDAPSSRRSSWSHFYTPGFPRGFYISGADPGGGAPGARPPPPPPLKLEKNMIFWREIVIFHTKYPTHFRASLRNWIKYDFLA